jgi:hypothetical protein
MANWTYPETSLEEYWPRISEVLREAEAQRPAILDEQWPAIVSYLDGDTKPLRTFVKKHVGLPTPSFLFPGLEAKGIGDLDEVETWEFIEHHKRQAEAKKAGNASERVRSKTRKFKSIDKALGILTKYYGKDPERVLLDEIEVVCLEEASELSDQELVRVTANLIRRKATENQKDPLQTNPLLLSDEWMPDSLARHDMNVVEALDYLQWLDNTAACSRSTRPSSLERETFALSAYMTNKEIAAQRNRSEDQIKQEKLRAVRKYRRAAGL